MPLNETKAVFVVPELHAVPGAVVLSMIFGLLGAALAFILHVDSSRGILLVSIFVGFTGCAASLSRIGRGSVYIVSDTLLLRPVAGLLSPLVLTVEFVIGLCATLAFHVGRLSPWPEILLGFVVMVMVCQTMYVWSTVGRLSVRLRDVEDVTVVQRHKRSARWIVFAERGRKAGIGPFPNEVAAGKVLDQLRRQGAGNRE